jgi:hypothetical protein
VGDCTRAHRCERIAKALGFEYRWNSLRNQSHLAGTAPARSSAAAKRSRKGERSDEDRNRDHECQRSAGAGHDMSGEDQEIAWLHWQTQSHALADAMRRVTTSRA